MGIDTTVFTFFVLIVIYVVFSEIFTVLFRLTGLKAEKAKFQVVSMITNSGFTTKESELILTSSLRRKLARASMVFGYLFAITAVSLFVNLLRILGTESYTYNSLFYGALLLLILALLAKSKHFVNFFDKCIEFFAKKYTKSEKRNYLKVYDIMNDKLIAEVKILDLPEILNGKPIIDLDFRNRFSLNILLIKRQDYTIDKITLTETIKENDTVLLYGSEEKILSLFNCFT